MKKNWIFYQSIGFCYLNAHGFKKDLFQQLTLESLHQRFPNYFEHDLNLSLVNTPQTTYEKIMIV